MKHAHFGSEEFAAETGTSREVVAKLQTYADLLVRWNAKINLIGKSTVADLWSRHMLDSAQLFALLPSPDVALIDMGSGAGFPGLVLAAMGVRETHLIEGDQRKAAFLREAAREMGAQIQVHPTRIEQAVVPPADVITARALAPLADLLSLSTRFTGPNTLHIYPKGQNVGGELTEAHKIWTMRVEQIPSRTDSAATILRISEVRRVRPVSADRPD